MHSNRVKEILNKVDYNLKEVFESVEINRLDNQREITFEVKLKGFKSNPNNKAELVMYMTESTIYDNSMIWKYKTNPLNENSTYVTRTSTLNSIAMDVEDIVTENRFAKDYLDTLLVSMNESVEYIGDDSPIRVKVTGKYAKDNAESIVNILDEFYDIDATFIDSDSESVILDVSPYSSYDGTREDFENFVNDNEYFHKVDDDYEFNFDEEVIVEGEAGIIIDRDKLVVENVEYNVYQVYIDGVQKSIFEYDLKKK